MKKPRLLAACLAGTGILAVAAVIGISQFTGVQADPSSRLSSYSTANPDTSQESASSAGSSSQESTAQAAAPETPKYRISVYNGYVAVFLAGYELPCQILETRVDSLPEYDQELLKEGLAARDERELNQMLQDYES